MSTCRICGKEIPMDEVHLIYAFVASHCPDCPAMELCSEHTNQFIDFMGAAKE